MNRITEEHIDSIIEGVYYFNMAKAVENEAVLIPEDHLKALSTTTVCALVLSNGFTITGKSACVDPNTFNEELGKKYAYEQAVDKVWELEGYLLKQNLHEKTQSQEMLKGFLQDDNCEGGGCKI
ncbi:gp48 [Escherichia phage N4]|uniref:Gp48 n=1 Tax=Enterobacteria phage N4 TaxID=2886925 RepID=A0MZD7_BPN4|nr:hypothetical protein EPNV4_gp48 [Escherichia phage N4]ABK54416.1 gp48 [Escherichia phage N4]